MNRRVNAKAGEINQWPTRQDFSLFIDQGQIFRGHLFEEQAKWIYPEMLRRPRHAQTDMSGNRFVHTLSRQDAVSRGQLDLELARFGCVGQLNDAPGLLGLGRNLGMTDGGGLIGLAHSFT